VIRKSRSLEIGRKLELTINGKKVKAEVTAIKYDKKSKITIIGCAMEKAILIIL
jgi:ribosomal 50S subunit-recycling heat shock protein